METTDSYLLLLIGVLVIALIAVELVPMPQPVTGPAATPGPVHHVYKAPKLNTGAVATVLVIGTSTLATVSVT